MTRLRASSHGSDRPSVVVTILVTLGAIHLVLACLVWEPVDFPTFLSAAQRLAERSPRPYEVEGPRIVPYVSLNPPHFHLLVLPFLALSPAAALWTWRILSIGFVVLAAALVRRHVPLTRRPAAALCAVLWSPAFVGSISLGQVTPLLMLPMVLFWHGARQNRDTIAGCGLGLVLSIKPIFWPLAVWLALERRWRGLLLTGVTGVVVLGLGVASLGYEPYVNWLETLRDIHWENTTYNASLLAAALRIDAGTGRITAALAGTALLLWTLVAVRRSTDLDGQLVALVTISILLSPLGWASYFLLAFVPLAGWLARGSRWPAAGWLLWIQPPMLLWGSEIWFVRVLWTSAYTWGLIAVWWAALRPSGSIADTSARSTS